MLTQTSQRVVVGVDASPGGAAALELAAAEAARRGVGLHLVHAYNRPSSYDPAGFTSYHLNVVVPLRNARRMVAGLATRVREAYPAVPVSTLVIAGNPARVLVHASTCADLLVVGARGEGGFTGLLLGSVAAQVTSHAACPVIVVNGRPAADGEAAAVPAPEREPLPVVVGVDGSANNHLAVGFAFEEASTRGVPLLAVHAWWSPAISLGLSHRVRFDVAEVHTAAEAVLVDALAGWREKYPDVALEPMLVNRPNPEQLLIELSRRAALVVVGPRGRGGFAGLLLGSVSRALIHHAYCPVAVVRHGDGET
jgi:nucleotide-binding universal stress UspA family protein